MTGQFGGARLCRALIHVEGEFNYGSMESRPTDLLSNVERGKLDVERFPIARIERLILRAAGYTFPGQRCKELFQLALARPDEKATP